VTDELDEIRYTVELDSVQRRRLDRYNAGWINPFSRYAYYRRKGHTPDIAFRCALAWAINRTDTAERRLSHQTGATQ